MKLFTAEQFTPTKFDTAEDKAKFANHFVRFVESDFKSTLFPKWFYTRLSMTFGHIAHYNQSGFYSEFFESTMDKVRFLEQTRLAGCYGSPEHTYCDVERVIVKWVVARSGTLPMGGQSAGTIEQAGRKGKRLHPRTNKRVWSTQHTGGNMINNHSTPSYLELKGALVCLGDAFAACLRSPYESQSHAAYKAACLAYRDARSILSTAQDAVRAELEAL